MTRQIAPEVQAVIEELKANCAATEAKIAAVPGEFFVLIWNDSVLRTNGLSVSLCGPEIHNRKTMRAALADAQRFAAAIKDAEIRKSQPVAVFPAAQALEFVKRKNAELIATIEKANS